MPAKMALVTGGNLGIGRDIAHRFARGGAKVVIAGRAIKWVIISELWY